MQQARNRAAPAAPLALPAPGGAHKCRWCDQRFDYPEDLRRHCSGYHGREFRRIVARLDADAAGRIREAVTVARGPWDTMGLVVARSVREALEGGE